MQKSRFSHDASQLTYHTFDIGELPQTQPTLYEYFWDMEQKLWIAWSKLVPKYVHVPEKKFNEILVPTVDTVRTTWLLNLMVRIKRPVVLVGETGTSKSATIANFLRTLDQESHVRKNILQDKLCKPRHEKTNILHMRKQRSRSAS